MNEIGKTKILSGVAVAASLSLVAPLATAVEVGMGVSLISGGQQGGTGYGISVPIRFGNFMIEPDLSYSNYSYDRVYPLAPASSSSYDSDTWTLETGFYWRQAVIASLEMYVGGRLGYTREKYTVTYPYSPGSNASSDTSGYYVGPTLGAEYFFNKNFSIGFDASILYSSTSNDYTASAAATHSEDDTNWYTQTRSRLRFYF